MVTRFLRLRSHVRALLPALLAASFILAVPACSGGDDSPSTTLTQDILAGDYELVGDIDGTQVKEDARVTLTLHVDGTLSLLAEQPGETLTDDGTWSIDGDKMTIAFTGLELAASGAAFTFDGTTLDLPVLIFGDGEGASRWRRTEPVLLGPDAASGDEVFSPDLETDWDEYDLDDNPAAAAMKTYVEAVNDRGMSLTDAVAAAVETARASSDVESVDLSQNGLNALIRFKDGRETDLITERFTMSDGAPASAARPTDASLIRWAPAAAPAPPLEAFAQSSCDALPASPRGSTTLNGTRLAEPGREGLVPSPVFGVPAYAPKDVPAPLTTDDSPAPDARRALIVSPLYALPHPGPRYDRNGNPIVGMWSGFKAGSSRTVDCVTADLKAAGYKIDAILGHVDAKKNRVDTADQALIRLVQLLEEHDYGVIYFVTHGAETSVSTPEGRKPVIKIQMGALTAADRERISGDAGLDHDSVDRLQEAIRTQVLKTTGLPENDEALRRSIIANFDAGKGYIDLWVSADFFRLVREAKGLDFSQTLIFANVCSSAANPTLRQAFEPRAFFGFDQPPDLDFSSRAANVLFDELRDKTRSARNAWQMWVRYESWVSAVAKSKAGVDRPPRTSIERLRAYGQNGIEYPPLADQSVVLIFRMRHGPPVAAERLQSSTTLIQNCWDTYWAAGTKVSGLGSKSCADVQLGEAPTQDEVEDALFEVGGGGARPFGRFTLAD